MSSYVNYGATDTPSEQDHLMACDNRNTKTLNELKVKLILLTPQKY